MPESQETDTYRTRRRAALKKATDQFVVRALTDHVEDELEIADAEQVSSAANPLLEEIKARSKSNSWC